MQVQKYRLLRQLPVIAAFASFTACDKAGFTYDNVMPGGNVQYTLIDTLSIQLRTVQRDSIPTSGTGKLLAGMHTDALFGKITAASGFRVGLPLSTELDDRAVYDSIELIMQPDGNYYGDTLLPQRFQVYQLGTPLTLPENYTQLYSHQTFPLASTPIGDHTVLLRPASGEKLHLRLSDEKGKELFTLLRNKATEVSSEDFFREYFKGLHVKGINNGAVYRFNASDSALVMRLHYHLSTTEVEEKYMDFGMTLPELQYNIIAADRSATPIQPLKAGEEGISSGQLDNRAFLQSLTGSLIRMDFPSLPGLPELGKYGRIMQAQLVIRPVNGTYVLHPLPPRLTLTLADKKHHVTAGDTLSTTGGYQYGNLQADKLYPEKTMYTYDVTDYCRAMVSADSYTYRGLILSPPYGEFYTQLQRLVVGDGKNSNYKAELKIYYLLYQ